MKKLKFALAPLLLAVFSACSSTYKIPLSRMQSSESEGGQQGSLQVGLHEVEEVVITTSISTVSVSSSSHAVSPLLAVGAAGSYGIFERLDLGADIEWGVIPVFFTKFQLIGDSKRQAKTGNVSFSLLAGIGNEASTTDNDTGVFNTGPGTIQRDASTLLEAGAIFGYRTSSTSLLAVGSSVLWQTIEGSQNLASGGNGIHFINHSRYTEIHGLGYFTFSDNSERSYFLTPSLQWGWTDTFGKRNYLTTGQVDIGVQL